MSKYIDAELIKSTKSLYNDIDSCIDELLKARVDHNQENEGKALFRMEGLMVATLQQLDCIIDSLQQEQSEVDLDVNKLIAKCRKGRDCKAAWEFYTKGKIEEAKKEE